MHYSDHILNQWLKDFSALKGQDFALNNQGHCLLKADNDISLQLFADDEGQCCWLNVDLVKLEQLDVVILAKALSMNLFQKQTRGAVIALDETLNRLFLSHRILVKGHDTTDFINIINNLVSTSLKIREQLSPCLPLSEGVPDMQAMNMLKI